ncbi:DUF866-domain-containing protein [Exidia glandulosa HHB12029]|uniref:DUF866-domain-containing protein n=1 Tax=Exidia glandulosa HHB12029 TaxID=1314781 RepID=A0A165PFF1_EXIGL|nr:DUF866-domain-containing protein [Exidia glandulosa HHB12029]
MVVTELENVTNLVPADDHFEYFFQVKCNSCHETHPNFVSVNRIEEREVSGGKGSSAHLVWRCKNCKREHSAKFEPLPPQPYTADHNGSFAPLITLDCRGLEPVSFDPRGIWKCEGVEKGTKFSEVDLSEGEWVDYDEKAAVPVSVMNIESQWARA